MWPIPSRRTSRCATCAFSDAAGAAGRRPQAADGLTVQRDAADGCRVRLWWDAAKGAQGYIVRYGIAPDKLYNNFQVAGGDTSLEIGSLNSGVEYYFTVDSYNECGITRGRRMEACR